MEGGVLLLRPLVYFYSGVDTELAGSLLLFFALYQVPIYLTPILAKPLYGRLLSGPSRSAS